MNTNNMNNEQKKDLVKALLENMPEQMREEVMNKMLAKVVDGYPNLSVEDRVEMRSRIDDLAIEGRQRLASMSADVGFVMSQVERIVEFDKNIEAKFDA